MQVAESNFLSFVAPVYGSPETLRPLRDRVSAVCQHLGVGHELILVDDGCPQGSWAVIRRLAREDPTVVGIRLSRNFGQHAAIQAGLSYVKGSWIVVMDSDLQDQPEEVPRMLKKAEEGFDIVRARRVIRRDTWYRRFSSRCFYMLLSQLTGTRQSPEIANFGVYRRKVINVITRWHEQSKYFPAIVQWVGFAQTEVSVGHAKRVTGKSSYTFSSLVALSMNVIVGFSDRPLKWVMSMGFAIAFASLFAAIFTLILHLSGNIHVEGWTSVVLSLWFLGGSLLFALGLTGLYVGRILLEVKGRPTFIVDELIAGTAVNPDAALVSVAADGLSADSFHEV
jgi:polyisoprenyl-phosphate glycosyltransferase